MEVMKVTLSRKDEAILLEEEGDDGMIHSLLTSLPNVVDEARVENKTKRLATERLRTAAESVLYAVCMHCDQASVIIAATCPPFAAEGVN
jgi:hypothetical protein